ncbi:HEPN domain-containing protein [Candidatus Woesearchaeota archaeon]|nr:HEPN domain-containing protein [Candidatus Woesearchaeota archaeon]
MDKLAWCKKQKNGIELIEQNQNLSQEYIEKAENALMAVKSLEGNKEWQISSAYYAMYFSLYAILMKLGIKCEIHACTIEIMKKILAKYFSTEEINLLQKSLTARIDAQYYTDRDVKEEQRINMIENAPKFHLKCKEIIIRFTSKETDAIRRVITKDEW